ncbi:beta-lactamase [alpha proteobacterium BAL199]|jgi:CubicO group peptidase (beta-lactamase class C family)|nr:beta-lactamase [alpha proteobacterium BAL199]
MTSLAAHSSLAPFADRTADPAALGFAPDRLARIATWMRRYVDDGKVPYLTTLVARYGEIAYLDACGSGDPDNAAPTPSVDHIARYYSMTKPITTVAAMMLLERALIQLDDPVAKYIPEFADTPVYVSGPYGDMVTEKQNSPVTVRQLMTHTSGLTYGRFDDGPIGEAYRKAGVDFGRSRDSLADMARKAASVPLCFQPGTKWTYSVATDVLGRVVEVAAGKPLAQVFQDWIFDPLGMVDTAFGIPDDKAARATACYEKTESGGMKRIADAADARFFGMPVMHSGGGGLVSTIPDYLRFLEMLRRGGEFDGARLLGRKTVDLMMMNHLPGDIASMGAATFSEMPMVGIGFGLGGSILLDPARAQVLGSAGEFAWGGVASTGFWIDRTEEISVVMVTQLVPSSSWPMRRELRNLVYQALVD